MSSEYWTILSESESDEVVSSLKRLYSYFDGSKIADFFASLYDSQRGGFYYTAGARDTDGYLPDLESTRQILGSLVQNGAIEHINSAFPDGIKRKILDFAKNMQSERDGYFYHPQWDQDKSKLQTDRYGRDIGNALTIISTFTLDEGGIGEVQYPHFCAPNGTKCEFHMKNGGKCDFPPLPISPAPTEPLAKSHPDYSSREAFQNWLIEYNTTVKENSGRAHNLSAIRSEITEHGYDDIVLDYLDRILAEVFEEQLASGEEPTGLWQRHVDYRAVWGFLKYSGWYNAGAHGRAIGRRYFPYIAKTFVKVISLAPDGTYASNDIFNQWNGIKRLMTNAKKYYGDDLVEQIREVLRQNTSALIDNTLLKIDSLAIGDGTFALKSNRTSPAKIYGTPISPGITEGNVNSTNIITATYRSIFEVLGYTPVPLMSREDGERFIEKICKNNFDKS